MNDKKNIDRLFQERFKDFERVPDDKIWSNIHDALHEKKTKRVLPLWWKLSGIAAGFILAFLAFTTFTNSLNNEPSVVVAPKEIENRNSTESNVDSSTETRIAVENNKSLEEKNDLNTNKNSINSTSKTENKVATNNANSSENEPDAEENINLNSQIKNTKTKRISTKKSFLKPNPNTAVAKNSRITNDQDSVEKNASLKEEVVENSFVEKSTEKTQLSDKTITAKSDRATTLAENKTPNKAIKNIDSTAVALASEPNPLEEIARQNNEKDKAVADVKINRWQVTTNLAPVYFNSATNGSPIESQFADNSKSYENNLSVGVGVQYAVNTKLSLRTGLNKMTLSYGTNDIMFFGALNSLGVKNVSATSATENIEVVSATNFVALSPFEDNLQNMETGVLNQRMGYFEVPLELSYALVNKKFGVHLIGGVSTLFLEENAVSVQSATTNISLGQANNLNTIHFSSNLGLGFKYAFMKNFQAHFEPTLKYQFNTFSRDAGNFRPYFVGLYTGVSYRF